MAASGVETLGNLYGFGTRAAAFAAEHVETLKHLDNPLANRCGEVLDQVVIGFGIGEQAALALIGVGQALLGNPLTGTALVSASVNPVVLTCASIGAVHYGWSALKQGERDLIIERVGRAFEIGGELIRAIIRYALDIIKALLSRENLAEVRKVVGNIAALFGRRLSEVTGAFSDRVGEVAGYTTSRTGLAVKAVTARFSRTGRTAAVDAND